MTDAPDEPPAANPSPLSTIGSGIRNAGASLQSLASSTFDRALIAQQPLAVSNVARLRRLHPGKTPAELIKYMDVFYLGTVTATGAGAGAASIVPNAVVQVPVVLVDLATFLQASVFYTLCVAEIHGVDIEDIERRRLLVTAVLIGNAAATSALEPLIGRMAPYWGKKIVASIPMRVIDAANKVLGPRFITKYGIKQGVLVLGKQLPLAIGVGIGAGGNHVFGRFVVGAARKILGPAPKDWTHLDGADSGPGVGIV